ncbi:PsiF repeat protein [Xylophilus rhododendri]|uniref:PsiF repeat protein n=1 Tax=Xylophilus rhododendri TaxID=2697032 RepID=A0A857JEC0_9BURK|nr:PsiF family protein [Xylophilus rhododendri]QHJ01026.1 PsiF repeat protein [Xylophilus rhododendri]
MKKIITASLLGLLLASGVHAAGSAQQNLMGTCNTEATGKKGEERKAFMSSCLSDGKKRQQEKMKMCNTDATGKKGDERKAFMSDCLKK